jgi:hypothetical protein
MKTSSPRLARIVADVKISLAVFGRVFCIEHMKPKCPTFYNGGWDIDTVIIEEMNLNNII